MTPPATDYRFWHDGLLGTRIEVRVGRDVGDAVAAEVDQEVVSIVERLELVFSAFDPASELNRWKRDRVADPSPEFVELMSTAQHWQLRSGGAFNPMVGSLTAMWVAAAERDELPEETLLRECAASIAEPRFVVEDGKVIRLGNCDDLNLNAIAKGYIVDAAVAGATNRFTPIDLLVSAGGDLLHRGERAVPVGIENPLRPYDNEPPLTTFGLRNAALATSGGARRGVRVRGALISHVIDPRSGDAVRDQASISVIADDAMTADVVATVLGVESPSAAVELANQTDVACLVVAPDGAMATSKRWPASDAQRDAQRVDNGRSS